MNNNSERIKLSKLSKYKNIKRNKAIKEIKNINDTKSIIQPKNNESIKNNTHEELNIIPKNIFQTWRDLELIKDMKETVEYLKYMNNGFNYYLYDDKMCRDFIKDNHDEKILEAYDKIIPGAYKTDLWRCCVLYKYGGIYLDIKYKPKNNFSFIFFLNKEYYVRDRQINNKHGIYNALMICKPNSYKLKQFIDKIVENIHNKYYGESALDISGPQCLNNFFTQKEILDFELEFDGNQILYKTQPILEKYSSYRTEQKQSGSLHYSKYWDKKMVYKK
jgi:mannosyltransferase OCH1-like enzyme